MAFLMLIGMLLAAFYAINLNDSKDDGKGDK
jgi:hypothetical protein